MYSYKRDTEGDLTHRREGNTTEAEFWGTQPQAMECQHLPEVEETKKFFLGTYGGKCGSANYLVLTQWNQYQISNLQNCEKINFYSLNHQVCVSVLLFVAKAYVSFYLSIFFCILFSIIMICIRIPVYLTFLKGDKEDRIDFSVATGLSCAVPTVILGFIDVFGFLEILKLFYS